MSEKLDFDTGMSKGRSLEFLALDILKTFDGVPSKGGVVLTEAEILNGFENIRLFLWSTMENKAFRELQDRMHSFSLFLRHHYNEVTGLLDYLRELEWVEGSGDYPGIRYFHQLIAEVCKILVLDLSIFRYIGYTR